MSEPTLDDLQEQIARALYEDTGCAIPWSLVTTDPDFEPRALTWRGHAAAALEALGKAGLVIVPKSDPRCGKAVVDRQDLAAILGTITPVVDDVPLTDDAITRLCTALKATTSEGGE